MTRCFANCAKLPERLRFGGLGWGEVEEMGSVAGGGVEEDGVGSVAGVGLERVGSVAGGQVGGVEGEDGIGVSVSILLRIPFEVVFLKMLTLFLG